MIFSKILEVRGTKMKKIQKNAVRFDNLKQDFLDEKKYSGTAEATLNGYRYDIIRFLKFLSDEQLAVNKAGFKQYVVHLTDSGMSVNSINHYILFGTLHIALAGVCFFCDPLSGDMPAGAVLLGINLLPSIFSSRSVLVSTIAVDLFFLLHSVCQSKISFVPVSDCAGQAGGCRSRPTPPGGSQAPIPGSRVR